MDTAILEHPVPCRLRQAVICNFLHLGTLMLRAEGQSARMSKFANNSLTRPWHRMLYSHMTTVGVKWLKSQFEKPHPYRTDAFYRFHLSKQDVRGI